MVHLVHSKSTDDYIHVRAYDLLQSSLLQLLIKELSPVSGSVVVDGKVSYASQEPWVFSGTLRENVLFGLPYKADWYQKVIEACSLDKVCSFVFSSPTSTESAFLIFIPRMSSSLLTVT